MTLSLPRFAPLIVVLMLTCALRGQDLRLKLEDPRLRMSVPASAAKPVLRLEATPYTAWLDFQRLAASRWIAGDLPEWMDPVEARTAVDPDGQTRTTFRLHFKELDSPGREVQLRVFFEDQAGRSPSVRARKNDGTILFASDPFGQGLGLPSSEILMFPTQQVDAIEIVVPGDGSNVRGVLLAVLAPRQIQYGIDFAEVAEVVDVFGNLPMLTSKADDVSLFGRVRAVIDPGSLKLAIDGARHGTWEFSLDATPLAAIVTFEVLNADSLAPLECILNDRPLGPASVHWPDLADPGYLGLARPLEKDMRFRYTGWLRAQKVIPGSALKAGINSFVLQLHPDSGSVAVRNVELQLKYNWKNLDYRLVPNAP